MVTNLLEEKPQNAESPFIQGLCICEAANEDGHSIGHSVSNQPVL